MNSGLWVSPTEFRSFSDAETAKMGLAGQIATRLAAGDLSGFMGLLPNPDPILKAMGQDIKVYRNLLVDPLIKGVRRRRSSAVLAMERGFDKEQSATPARVLKACEQLLARSNVQQLVRDLMDGAFFGYRVGELIWGFQDGVQSPRLICKPGEWFGFDAESGDLRFKPRTHMAGIPVDPRKFVVVGKLRSWENPFGEPDLAACFWPVTFKRGGMRFWMTFTEKYGMPWAVGKQPRTSTPAEANDLADKLAAMVRDAVAVVPDDASVELLQASGTANAEMYEKLLMFCRSEISIALLGNNQSVEMQSNKASAEAAAGIEQHLRDDDAEMVADGINQMVRAFCQINFPGAEPPVYAFWEQEEVDEVLAGRDQKLRGAGANFTPAYFERVYNLQPGDLAAAPPPVEASGQGSDGRAPTGAVASFADAIDATPADQAALDDAIDQLATDDAVSAAVQKMIAPAIEAIQRAVSPEEVQQLLLDAFPKMDSSALEALTGRAYFIADLVGGASAGGDA